MNTDLAQWTPFYSVAGGAAATLIGLQFVALTLIAEHPPKDGGAGASAFASPTVVHFSAPLFLALIVHAPWQGIAAPAVLCGALGFAGVVYSLIVTRRMRGQSAYRPAAEDWIYYVVLPAAAYTVLAVSGAAMPFRAREALFGVAAAALSLLFLGVRNSWDSITYHLLVRRPARDRELRKELPQ